MGGAAQHLSSRLRCRLLAGIALAAIIAGCSRGVATDAPAATESALREVVDVAYERSLLPSAAGGVSPGTEVKLDVYAPSEGGPWPVVIWAPGGGETKAAGIAFGRLMASYGAVVFVVDWAHGVDPTPEPPGIASRTFVEQAACAVRTSRALAPKYGGDATRIIWTGYSLGGMFGAELAFADPDFERSWAAFEADGGGPPPTIDCLTAEGSATIDALVIASSGRYIEVFPTAYDTRPVVGDFTEGISHIGNNQALKVRHVHGTADSDVPFALAESLDRQLQAAGYDAKLIAVEGGGHEHFDSQLVELVLEVLGS